MANTQVYIVVDDDMEIVAVYTDMALAAAHSDAVPDSELHVETAVLRDQVPTFLSIHYARFALSPTGEWYYIHDLIVETEEVALLLLQQAPTCTFRSVRAYGLSEEEARKAALTKAKELIHQKGYPPIPSELLGLDEPDQPLDTVL